MGRTTCSARGTCDSYRSLDIRQLHREGRVRAGQSFSILWSYRGEPLGSVAIITKPDLMVLTFQRRSSRSEEWETVEQRMPVVWMSIRFQP
jgi:hypothetical protein